MTDAKVTDAELITQITEREESGELTFATLLTDDRVLARITDGIYRQPASALRELIANAYDADATEVVIQTDLPRFSAVSVRDNGLGMNKKSLVRLINHIGGSSKRTYEGAEIGVTNSANPTLSPSGRRLIGKIGIGLFSVSQLTRRFRVITKQAGAKYRLIAEVTLRTYSEDDLPQTAPADKSVSNQAPPADNKDATQRVAPPDSGDTSVVTGTVAIHSVPAEDVDSQGTQIVLLELHPSARDMLRSKEVWDRVSNPEAFGLEDFGQKFSPPPYHVGRVDPSSDDIVVESACLPWDSADPPDRKFHKLYSAVVSEIGRRNAKPSLGATLDRYLQTLWVLSLSAPLEYLDGIHPFDLDRDSLPKFYRLSNSPRESAGELKLKAGQTLRAALQLKAPDRRSQLPFNVFVDDVKLFRPLRFEGLPGASRKEQNKRPLLFVGQCAPPVDKMPPDVAGGRALAFEAYFLWTPKVAPTDHNGVMVRISDASGTLFDDTFFSYQVAEIQRLSQITAEIFVTQGLDAALNIDRESFNFGHPHAKIVSSWVHRALRQIATAHKKVTKEDRDTRRESKAAAQNDKIDAIVEEKLGEREPATVVFVDDASDQPVVAQHRIDGSIVLARATVLAGVPPPAKSTAANRERELFEKRMVAVTQLLEAYGIFKRMTYDRQQELLNGIAKIFGATGAAE